MDDGCFMVFCFFCVVVLARIIHNSHRGGGPGSIRLIRSRLLALKALAEAQIPDRAPKRASKTSSQVLKSANKI